MESPARTPERAANASGESGARPAGFRLIRYFTLATLIAFAAVGLALYFLQRNEIVFFAQVQRDQGVFLAQAQAELARQHQRAARASLLAVHEASHVTLTRLVSNLLWESDFGPFVQAAQRVPVDHCRKVAAADGAASTPAPQPACFGEIGKQIMALPGFKALDTKAYEAMRASTVFKIKVFDLRGITIYSSEHTQIGEDRVDNLGWRSAVAGLPASELTHRDRFSAFERVVENRDLISTYVPVRAAGSDLLVGVFEIYSDVTPFLGQIQEASKVFGDLTSANEARVGQIAQTNQDKVSTSSDRFLLIVGGLLALLYAAAWLIVRNGQRIIDRQSLAHEHATLREQVWHREKMGALATMSANVSHEVGNPLAIISGLAEGLADRQAKGESVAGSARQILEQTERVARMMRQISDFATARNEQPEWVDVNAMLKSLCDFFAFDRRFRATPIEFRPGDRLPARELVPDHLNEVMMNLLQACVDGDTDPPLRGPIRVETQARDDDVEIRISGKIDDNPSDTTVSRMFTDGRFESVRRRIQDMGGEISSTPTTVIITLPPSVGAAGEAG